MQYVLSYIFILTGWIRKKYEVVIEMREFKRFINWLSKLEWWVLLLLGVVIGMLID